MSLPVGTGRAPRFGGYDGHRVQTGDHARPRRHPDGPAAPGRRRGATGRDGHPHHGLTAGTTYANATRYPFNGSGPGLAIYGEGRGCNELTGSFTATEATFGGPDSSYVQDFVATFEQHCEGAEPALRGTISIHNPPAPEPLELGLTVAGDGIVSRVTGRATVHGTVTCTEPVTVAINGTLTQVVKKTILSGPLSTQVACTPGAPVPWQAVAIPSGTTPFGHGDAEVEATASAQDPNFGGTVSVSQTQVVQLRRA
jgi:hypothetical protein